MESGTSFNSDRKFAAKSILAKISRIAEHATAPQFERMAKPPDPLNLEDLTHRGENWRRFAQDWTIYEIALKLM